MIVNAPTTSRSGVTVRYSAHRRITDVTPT